MIETALKQELGRSEWYDGRSTAPPVSQILGQNGRLYSDVADLNKRTDDIVARLSGVVERLKGPAPAPECASGQLGEPIAILGQVNRANGRLQEIASLLSELEELV